MLRTKTVFLHLRHILDFQLLQEVKLLNQILRLSQVNAVFNAIEEYNSITVTYLVMRRQWVCSS